LTLMIFKQMVM